MNRKEFIRTTLATGVYLSTLPVFDLIGQQISIKRTSLDTSNNNESDQYKIFDVFNWLKTNNWDQYLSEKLSIDISLETKNEVVLTARLENIEQVKKIKGLEDFGGNKLIERGKPSLSLLYHIMASPRVKSELFVSYPTLEVLDKLEDYIYSFVNTDSFVFNKNNVCLAVLSYEYRSAFKTPPFEAVNRLGNQIAQLVFSRCGISRIGTHVENYDTENRSFTNLPFEKNQEKNTAVMPARYGLFLVELVDANSLENQLMNLQTNEFTRFNGKRETRYFIQPIKKIYDTKNYKIQFAEYHLNEKLKRLADYSYKEDKIELKNSEILNLEASPFTRINSTLDNGKKTKYHRNDLNLVKLSKIGSSALLASVPRPLIWEAKQNGKQISFKVPDFRGGKHYNRRYGALKLPNEDGHETTNVLFSDILGRRDRRNTGFRSPKIAPLFANIKYEHNDISENHINGTTYKNDTFEDKIRNGGYYAALFEDSICDGCIAAEIINKNETHAHNQLNYPILSAFSLVTAPDFFPYIDSNDIRSSYRRTNSEIYGGTDSRKDKPYVNTDQDFFEGGTLNLSGIRQRGNPYIKNPFTGEDAFKCNFGEDKTFDTITAVLSLNEKPIQKPEGFDFKYNFNRDYIQTSHLPDTGTGVFYPGWDVTYSGPQKNPFLSTFGLGSPFPEDMKLCASANGMWPVTSPDAGRTFQGSLEPIFGKRPNTAIPLMDIEIGLHKNSPHLSYGLEESLGWDGEQGPFIQVINKNVFINYTDIERADYLQNLQNSKIGFDASLLRRLESKEIIQRMDAQRLCIKTIDKKKVWATKLWLVSALKIENWKKQITVTSLPQDQFFENIDLTQAQNKRLEGEGYFFVYAKTKRNKNNTKGDLIDPKIDESQKRRLLECKYLWICQVSRNAIAYLRIKNNKIGKWKIKSYI